ncbi:MAG TPA: hypothetical protein DCZ03_00820 [Gammaproteobacteria bacterium]|nr:hypothetical protein [Gammaproteobacteria bacterium]
MHALDFVVMDDPNRVAEIAIHSELQQPMNYRPDDVDLIIEFLHALTDENHLDNRDNVPLSVPSGLPIFE